MVQFLPVPFVVYWLVVKDFLYSLDVCDNNYNETGYCLSNSQCSNIVQGKIIGPCDSESSGSICCKITLNYYNATYLLSPIFARKSQTERTMKMMLFSANTCSRFNIQYGNKSISSERKKKMISIDTNLQESKIPDRIMWPIYASYSRESRDLQKQSSGQNHLYVVTLDKLDTDETEATECLPESDKSDEDKFYVVLNPAESFPIRKFFTSEMKRDTTMNLTVDVKNLFEVETEKRSGRSVNHNASKQEDSTCTKKQWKDILSVDDRDENCNSQRPFETVRDIHKHVKTLTQEQKMNKSMRDYVLESESKQNEWMEVKDINKAPSSDKQSKSETTPQSMLSEELIHDYVIQKSEDVEEKRTVKLLRPYRSVKGDSVSVRKEIISDELNSHPKNYLDDSMDTEENLTTHNLKKPVSIEAIDSVRYQTQVDVTHIRKPIEMDAQSIRKLVDVDVTHDLKKAAQGKDTHNLRVPVKTEATHDLRKPVQIESTHDIRIPVQIHTDHNMRESTQLARESVEREVSHDLRKPVVLNESHDLRWPVLEEETDLRSADLKRDESDKRNKLNGHATVYNFHLACNVNVSLSKKDSSSESASEKRHKQFTDMWEEASKVCGKYSEDGAEGSREKMTEKWPWMVSLLENISGRYAHKCSAALLNSLWVITVAHCVDMKPKSDLKLILRSLNQNHAVEMSIDEILIHPRFNRGLFENDIALLRMKQSIAFQPSISPICLPWSVGELKYGTPAFLGWELKHSRISDDSENLTVPLITNYECEVLYSAGKNREKIKDTFLCAGKDDENCDSESGSSLIALNSEGRWSLIGLVSWGSMCAHLEQPGVYVRISSYAQWIKDSIDCYENVL